MENATEAKPVLEFKDISDELWRKYEYPGGYVIDIVTPSLLNVSASGGHRVLDGQGISHYIMPGWKHLTWRAKQGTPAFRF